MPIRKAFRRKTKIVNPSATTKDDGTVSRRRRQRCVVWIKLGLSASIPLLIAVFTIVSYVQTNHINERNRQKDIEIANLTRLQEQKLADEQRQEDQRKLDEQRQEDQRKLDEQRREDQRKADEIHHQTLFGNYIEEISSIIFKQNQSMFTSEDMKMLYIRRKTLLTLRSIDSARKSQLFIFLYENNLLPTRIKSKSTVDLSGADLSNITVQSPATNRYNFTGLSLKLVNLMDARFIHCNFINQTDFSGSTLINTQFVDAFFDGELNVNEVNLINASFAKCNFRGIMDFRSSNLLGVSFQQTWFTCGGNRRHIFSKGSMVSTDFQGAQLCNIDFEHVNLSYADFRVERLQAVSFVDTILFHSMLDITTKRISTMKNSHLPNGTWTINSENFIKNGDAEANCYSFNGTIQNWNNYSGSASLYHHNETLMTNGIQTNFCCFGSKDGHGFLIYQTVFFPDIQMLLQSGEAEYNLSACFGGIQGQCKKGQVQIRLSGYSSISLLNPHIPFSESQIKWQCRQITSSVNYNEKLVQLVMIEFGSSSEYCFVDNIQLYVKAKLDKY